MEIKMRNKSYIVLTYDKDNYCVLRREYRCINKDEAVTKFKNYYASRNIATSKEYIKAFDRHDDKDKDALNKHYRFLMRHSIKKIRIDSNKSDQYRIYVGDETKEMILTNHELKVLSKILDSVSTNLINIERID